MSDKMRITGMASGLDVDATVKQMMKPYNMKLDKEKQDRQIMEWQQNLYRDIIGDLSTFRSTYFDVLKSDTNMLSSNNYAGFDVTSINAAGSTESTPVAATAVGAGVTEGSYKVEVTRLASGATFNGNAALKNATTGVAASAGSKMIELDPAYVQTTVNLTYNGGEPKALTIKASDTIQDVINNINSVTEGNVTAKYSELTGKFSIMTTKTGGDGTLTISGGISALKIDAGSKIGDNAELKITPPGGTATDVTRATNTFTIDGVNYNLTKPGTANITVSANTQKVFDKIKGFIDKYNEIVEKVNTKVDEKKQYTYKPLTDEQKKDMKTEEITKWEDKAKVGLLKNDSMLNGLLDSMRYAFFQGVEGAGISLKDLGLSTSSDTSQRGKIVFDQTLGGEQKLKETIKTRGQQVANLFMKSSTSQPYYNPDLTEEQRKTRTSEEGIFSRIDDIMQDYVRTNRDKSGKKGLLIQKAGLKGDFTNLLYGQMKDKDKVISDLTKKLADKENKFYLQFSKLETAMNNLNSQSNWLAQQLGTK